MLCEDHLFSQLDCKLVAMFKFSFVAFCLFVSVASRAQVSKGLQTRIDKQAKEIEQRMIEWRRNFHQNPELSNREFKTAATIAEHLKALGIEVQTGVAHTGVVGILKGGKPGPVIALRADMDALPVTERNSLPFASKETATFNGQETGVMHACGHDAHVAILMSAAEILSKNKNELKGTIKFIFQPAEEGPPAGEKGGAGFMVEQGVLETPKVDVIFGLHVRSITKLGVIEYRPKGFMAASDWFTIKVYGKQSHGSRPWLGIDPIVVASQIITGLQTIVSRQTDLTEAAAVISVGRINSGIRENIIPEMLEMSGTIRTFDVGMQKLIHEKIKLTATKIAESSGARAEVTFDKKTPVTYNDDKLTRQLVSSLQRAAGETNVVEISPDTGSEDFAYYQEKIPGLFFFVGACPPEVDPAKAPSHHTPDFRMDERSMLVGLKAMLQITIDYMYAQKE
jgi:amidohydrolase